MVQPELVRVAGDELTVPEIDQVYYQVGRRNKHWALVRVLANSPGQDLLLIFCATKMMCDRLVEDLLRWDFAAAALHGDLPQNKREHVLADFAEGKIRILVATDVAARGLDIDRITHVINWDLPDKEPEIYVHRIGRTGRAGRKGTSISFVSLDDKSTLKRIEMLIGRPIPLGEPPANPDGRPDKIERKTDWDELADKYGLVHVRVNAGQEDGVTAYLLHKLVQRATRLPDHAITQIHVEKHESMFAVPKDSALTARERLEGVELKSGRKLDAEFESKETTVRTA
jgi:ATP-dependent RNA helicase DeaD